MRVFEAFSLAAVTLQALADTCGLRGPAYPAPTSLAADGPFQSLIRNITVGLDAATKAGSVSGLNLETNETSYSVGVFDTESTLLSYQHTATNPLALAGDSVRAVDENTVYRVGSNSKLLTAYTILVEVGHAYWHRSATEFIPELAAAAVACNSTTYPLLCPDWDSITLGALANHQAGIGRGHQPTTAAKQIPVPAAVFGLPSAAPNPYDLCRDAPCSRQDALNAFFQEPPQYLPLTTPVYSNAAYQLLGYAIENITSRNFSDLITNDVFCPLGMANSSYTLPNGPARGIIPGNDTASFWAIPQGDAGPAGGIYSTQNDMAKLGQAILKNTQLSGAVTREWMKPDANTVVWQQNVGKPWEIERWPVGGRIVDLYTKGGDLGAYHTIFALVPDYNVGVVVLVAGGTAAAADRTIIFETLMSALVPGLEATARSQAQRKLAGSFASAIPDLNSSITLTTEPSVPGLRVTSFISNSTDTLRTLYAQIAGIKTGALPDVRLYPSNLSQESATGGAITSYHAVINDPSIRYPSTQLEALNCVAWQLVDLSAYGATGLDEFWIETDKDGKAVSVLPRAFGVTLIRK